MKKMRSALILGTILAGGAGLVFATNSLCHATTPNNESRTSLVVPSSQEAVPTNSQQIQLSFAPVARAVQPSVVNIFTARVVRQRAEMGPFFSLFNTQPRVENSLGSGVIVDSKGLIITNNHVVDGADQIVVALADRREFPAKLIFSEPRLDLALLQVDSKRQALPVARLGDSDRAQVGDLVLAIGNPFGVGQTVTQGIVSATARSGVGVSDAQFFIQTDASINQGNSGGALVAMNGEVIGVNSAILTGGRDGGSIGLGFAIPSNMVKAFLRGAETGKLVTAWIGVEGEALDADAASSAGLDRLQGILVTGVSPGSPAAIAGLKAGDIIWAIDGKDVLDPSSLRYQIATHPVGSKVGLTVIRNRKSQEIELSLVAPPEVPPRQETILSENSMMAGTTIANLSPALAQELGAGLPEHGVVVVRIPNNAPAARLGFPRPGDVVEAINGQKVRTVAEVEAQLRQGSPRRTLLQLIRNGQKVECVFEAPGRAGCRAA